MNTQLQSEVMQSTFKSYELSSAMTKTNLFSKIKLKPVSRLIIVTLVNMYNPRLGYSFPGIEKLTLCTGYTDRQIKEGLKELSESFLIVRTSKKIYFTKKFYELLDLENLKNESEVSSEKSEVSTSKSEVSSPAIYNKQIKQNIKQENFIFKNILDLQKTDTISYFESVQKLSGNEREHLCKIKLEKTYLTDFQKTNLDKFIMLTDSEIKSVNTKEPYFRQENIDIYYNQRMKKIREFSQIVPVKDDRAFISAPPENMRELLKKASFIQG